MEPSYPELNPISEPTAVDRVGQFDEASGEYDRFVNQDIMRNGYHYPSVLTELGDVEGMAILDVGCGAGQLARMLAEKGAHVTAYDGSPNLIAEDQATEEENPLGITYIEAKTSTFETEQRFNNAVSVLVLPYMKTVEELGQAFASTAAVLKEGGRFISAVISPSLKAHGQLIGGARRFTEFEPHKIRVEFLNSTTQENAVSRPVELTQFTFEEYQESALQNGFSQVEWKELQPSPEVLEQFGPEFWEQIGTEQPYLLLITTK